MTPLTKGRKVKADRQRFSLVCVFGGCFELLHTNIHEVRRTWVYRVMVDWLFWRNGLDVTANSHRAIVVWVETDWSLLLLAPGECFLQPAKWNLPRGLFSSGPPELQYLTMAGAWRRNRQCKKKDQFSSEVYAKAVSGEDLAWQRIQWNWKYYLTFIYIIGHRLLTQSAVCISGIIFFSRFIQ